MSCMLKIIKSLWRHRIRCIAVCCVTAVLCAVPVIPPSISGAGKIVWLGSTRIKDRTGREVELYRESHALIIGVNDYIRGWPDLPGVSKDVWAVKRALEQQGFHVITAENPTRRQLDEAFSDFITRYGQEPDNRLIFYFAGHGHTLTLAYGGEMGYIVPADAPNPSEDRSGFLAKAVDMQQIEVYARRIQSKHALFLFDSCFSGTVFSITRAIPENISYKAAEPVRQFITSGSAEEKVPDESIFRRQFIAALQGEGDVNKDGYVTGAELGEFLQEKVVNYSRRTQHPQYGKIRDPNLDKGDIVFSLARKAQKKEAAGPDVEPARLRLEQLERWQKTPSYPATGIAIHVSGDVSDSSPGFQLYQLLRQRHNHLVLKSPTPEAFNDAFNGNAARIGKIAESSLILGRMNFSCSRKSSLDPDLVSCDLTFVFKTINPAGDIIDAGSRRITGAGFSEAEAGKSALEKLVETYAESIFSSVTQAD